MRGKNVGEDQLASFIFRVPGLVLKSKGSQVVFKPMRSKGGKGGKGGHLLKLMSPAERKEEELKLTKKTKNMKMMRNQIRLGLLRALRYSK